MKTLIAVYEDFELAQEVVQDLVQSGFPREDISLVVNDSAGDLNRRMNRSSEDVSAGEGAGFGAVVGTLLGLGISLIPGIGPVLGAGPLAVALTAGIGAAAGAVTGGITAALIDLGLDEDEAGYYAEAVRRGMALVTVNVQDAWVTRAEDVLNRHAPSHIEEHAAYWRQSGWQGFDPNARAMTESEIEVDRAGFRSYSAGRTTPRTSESGSLPAEDVVQDRQLSSTFGTGGVIDPLTPSKRDYEDENR